MKYLQFVSSGKKLSEVISSNFTPMQHLLRAHKDQAVKESLFYVREKRANNVNSFVKGKTQVTVLTPKELFNKPVFTLKDNDIAYVDNEIVVVDKPAGVPSQPTRIPFEDHLFGAVIAYFTRKTPQKLAYVGMHHRLDRDTSGLILFSLKSSMNKSLAEQFQNRQIKKTYMAVVTGAKPKEARWKVKASIGRMNAPKRLFKFGVDEKRGDPAETHFTYVSSINDDTHIIECSPITGRTHQIRIHLAHSKLPILGDRVYGGKKADRMHLHASKLTFTHPKTNKVIEVISRNTLTGGL